MRLSQLFRLLLAMTVGLAVICVFHVARTSSLDHTNIQSIDQSYQSIMHKFVPTTHRSARIKYINNRSIIQSKHQPTDLQGEKPNERTKAVDSTPPTKQQSITNLPIKPSTDQSIDSSKHIPTNQPIIRSNIDDANNQSIQPECDFTYSKMTSPQLMYRVHAEVLSATSQSISQSNNLSGINVKLSIKLNCAFKHRSSDPSVDQSIPRASFRVHSTGVAYAALAPSQTLLKSHPSTVNGLIDGLEVIFPLTDAGDHSIHVKLMSIGLSEDALRKDYKWQEKLNETELMTHWVNQPITGSPINISIDSSMFESPPQTYQSLLGPPSSDAKLCFSDGRWSGRWLLGPETEFRRAFDGSESIFNHFDPIYAPHHCAIDYAVSFIDELRKHRWLHLIGDSNTRYLFMHLCDALKGDHYDAIDEQFRLWDNPHFCLIDGGRAVVTYTHWHWGMKLPLADNFSFASQCARYTENSTVLWSDREFKFRGWPTQSGWPNCSLAHDDVMQLSNPGLTLFAWGSHAAEKGANVHMHLFFMNELLGHPYFAKYPTLLALTPDVDSQQIPSKFGPQYIYRNVERIEAVNSMLRIQIMNKIPLMPVNMLDDNTQAVDGFIPIYDLFSVSHAIAEASHTDAVHFVHPFHRQTQRVLAHFLHHAPQLRKGLKRNPIV